MWLDKLRDMKKSSGLTTKEISVQSGVPEPTLEKLFAGSTKDPKLETMRQLVHFLGYTLDDLEDGDINTNNTPDQDVVLSPSERELIEKFRLLDDRGKSATLNTLSHEFDVLSGKPVQPIKKLHEVQKNQAAARSGDRQEVASVSAEDEDSALPPSYSGDI